MNAVLERRNLKSTRAAISSKTSTRSITAWLFLLPLFAVIFVVMLAPSIESIYYSLTDWNGIGAAKFIGISNYLRMLQDKIFWRAFSDNLKWTLVFLIVPIVMGLLGASLLAPIRKGQMLYRIGFFLPYTFASVVNAQIWRYILSPEHGIGAWLSLHGFPWLAINFWGNQSVVLYSIMFVGNWQWWGFLVLLYLAAMQSIDNQLYEAARIEGANRWQEFIYVTFPGIRPTFVFMILMTTMWSFLVFDYIYILTGGGPNHASEVLGTYAYSKAFTGLEAGYGAAIAMTMSFICAIIIAAFVYLRKRGWEI